MERKNVLASVILSVSLILLLLDAVVEARRGGSSYRGGSYRAASYRGRSSGGTTSGTGGDAMTGIIIGAVIGGIVLIALIGVVVYFCYVRAKDQTFVVSRSYLQGR